MLFPSVRNVGLLVLGALIVINPILSGAGDVSVPLDPLGPLKVALDYALATTWPEERRLTDVQRNLQFSSHIVFASRVGHSDEENPPVSDGQLWQIARDAVDEMVQDREQYGIGKKKEPKAMGILAWGNEIIIASSMRGAGHFSYDFLEGETPVGKSLQKCQILNVLMSMFSPKVQLTNVQDLWGCNLFIQDQGLRAISTSTPPAPYTLANLAGGPTRIEQIQLCGGQPRVFVG